MVMPFVHTRRIHRSQLPETDLAHIYHKIPVDSSEPTVVYDNSYDEKLWLYLMGAAIIATLVLTRNR